MEIITGVHNIRNKLNKPPRITIQPPDDYNLAKSMPDISLNINYFKSNNEDGGNTFSSNSDISLDESDDNFEINQHFLMKRPLIKKRSFSESNSASINLSSQQEVPIQHNFHHYHHHHQPQKSSTTCFKKKDISPSDVLKHKLKSSLSLHNLNASNNNSYDKYHTVHGNCETSSSSSNSSNVFHDTNTSSFNNKSYYVTTEDLTTSITSRNQKNHNIKCCCGKSNCATVVPLQQYLETYFTKMVRVLSSR